MHKLFIYSVRIILLVLLVITVYTGFLSSRQYTAELIAQPENFQQLSDTVRILHAGIGYFLTVVSVILWLQFFMAPTERALVVHGINLLITGTFILLSFSGYQMLPLHFETATAENIHHYGALFLFIMITLSFVTSLGSDKQTFLNIIFPPIHKAIIILPIVVCAGLIFMFVSKDGSDDIPVLTIAKTVNKIQIDGIILPREWDRSDSLVLPLFGGANFDDGKTEVVLKALYDNQYFYLKLAWEDKTRSLNRYLIKKNLNWSEQQTGPEERFGEKIFYEDQAAIFLSQDRFSCLASCHADQTSKIKYHAAPDSLLDVWFWKAVSTNPIGFADDGWLSWKTDSAYPQIQYDNKAGGGYLLNLNMEWKQPYFMQRIQYNQSWIDLKYTNAVPYFSERDSLPEGTRLPAILLSSMTGDRSDVRAAARWSNGRWEMELSRKLKTGSPHDISLYDDFYLSLALFDNAELSHAISPVIIKCSHAD